ncbi:MAG: NUDIX hydrolase [Pseudonocardiaceae bacterium]
MIDSGAVMAWEALGEQVKLEGFRRVVSRRYRLPTGEEADWDILAGGRTVAIVALTEDDRVVLVRQFRPGPAKVLLELPGGNVDRGESVEAAAERELLEETGFAAGELEVVAQTWLAAYATVERYAVVARGCRRVAEPEPDQGEFLEPVELSMSEFVAHVLGGQLTDADIALRGLVALGVLTQTC